MRQHSLWETLGIALMAGLLVILLLPFGRMLLGGSDGPGRGSAERPARGVLATLEHGLDRLVRFDFASPGGQLFDRLEISLLLIMVIAVGLLVFAPRVLLIVVGLVAGFVLLEPFLERFTNPGPGSSGGPGGADSWFNLLPGHLSRLEGLILLGIAATIAFLAAQRRTREERLAGNAYRARAQEEQ